MKKIILALVFLACLLGVNFATNINACGVIALAGTYDITADLTGASASPCLTIIANDVYLDGHNHIITGDHTQLFIVVTWGIASSNSNTTIRNVNVTSFGYQIWMNGSTNSLIENATLTNFDDGAERQLYLTSASYVTGVNLTGDTKSDYGFFVLDSHDILGVNFSSVGIKDNRFMLAQGSSVPATTRLYNISFMNSSFTNDATGATGWAGMRLINVDNGTISGNKMNGTGGSGSDGILIWNSTGFNVENNTINMTALNDHPLRIILASSNNSFKNNTLNSSRAGNIAINLDSTVSGNSFLHNNITSDYWINDSSSDAVYNDSTSGNIYYFRDGSKSWNTYDINVSCPPNWATGGANRPLNSTISGHEWLGNGNDYHPWTENGSCASNTAPNITALSISPTNPIENQVLTCNATATDKESNLVNLTWNWTKNGATYSTDNATVSNNTAYLLNITLTGPITDPGDNWSCTVWANDSLLNSTPNTSANATVIKTPLSGCLNLANASTYFNLTVSLNSTGTCFNVTAASINFDGGNNYVNGSNTATTSGINVTAFNFTGQNVNVSRYTLPIILNASNFSFLNNVTVNGSWGGGAAGIYLTKGSNSTVINRSLISNTNTSEYGILSDGAHNVTVSNSTILTTTNNAHGIFVRATSANWTIFNNTINSSSGTPVFGIVLASSTVNGTNISSNNINMSGSGSYAVYLNGSSTNTLSNNFVWSTLDAGIRLESGANNNTISFNTIPARAVAIYTDSSSNNSIRSNAINTTNGAAGISLNTHSDNDSIANNTIITTGGASVIAILSNSAFNYTIANNTLTCKAAAACLGFSGSSQNVTVFNNTITSTNATAPGILISAASVNLTNISFNTINVTGANSPSINISGGYNLSISSNLINNTAYDAISLSGGANFSTIFNNTINATGNGARGIRSIYGNSNMFANNTINTSGTNGYGIWIGNLSTNDTLYNNTIWTNGTASHGIFLINTTVNATNITLNRINVSGGPGAQVAAMGINLTNTSGNTIFNNTIWTNLTSGEGIVSDTAANGSSIYANNITSHTWINDTNGSNFYNVSSIGNIYYLTTGGGVWSTGNGTNLTVASPPGWSTSGYGVNTTNFPPYWPGLGNDFFAWTENSAGGGAPDLNCTFQTNIHAIIFQPHFKLPGFTANFVNATNQTNPTGLYNCTNNGTASGTLQAKVNQTDAGIIKVASCNYFVTNLTLTTSFQDLVGSCATLAAGASINVSRYNNYSTGTLPFDNLSMHIRS